ncbi:MAG: hypothetical protein ABIJ16_11230 [Bacteroidota bacterium]
MNRVFSGILLFILGLPFFLTSCSKHDDCNCNDDNDSIVAMYGVPAVEYIEIDTTTNVLKPVNSEKNFE